jgi:hypothetical protein
MTPERKAEILAEIEQIIGPSPRRKPKVVARDDLGTVRDADVLVSRADPNAVDGQPTEVQVRRPDWVTVNMQAYEEQVADEAARRKYMRSLDPARWGLYGPVDED